MSSLNKEFRIILRKLILSLMFLKKRIIKSAAEKSWEKLENQLHR